MPLAIAMLVPLAAPAAPEAQLELSVGVLGHEITYLVRGDPFEVFGVAPALTEGPTPLSLIDPGDPRFLDVGIELLPLWKLGVLDAAGEGSLSYALPPDPALAGTPLYAQAVTAPGTATLVDEITNQVALVLALEGDCHLTLGSLAKERRHHTATTLPGGKILIAGGLDPHPPGSAQPHVYGDGELYDPLTSEFEPPFTLPEARARHTATRLQDGRVLLLGGIGPGGTPLASGTVYDPADGSFTPVPPMLSARVLHTATLLDDGKVFVAGGSAAYSLKNPIGYPASLSQAASATTEIYDPTANSWTAGPDLPAGRTAHEATRLSTGVVLLSGGFVFLAAGPQTTTSCRLFDPASPGSLPLTAPLEEPLCFHSAVLTAENKVLVTGGGVVNLGAATFTATQGCQIFDPDGDAAWTVGPSLPGYIGPDGRTICTQRQGTGGGGGGLSVIGPNPIYVSLGGTGNVDFMSGDAGSPGDIYITDASFSGWSVGGTTVLTRPQLSVAVEEEGLRVLITGAAVTPGVLSAEVWTVDY